MWSILLCRMDKHLSHHSQLRTISSRILMKFEREEREKKKVREEREGKRRADVMRMCVLERER